MFEKLKIKAAELKRDLTVLYWAARDPRTPWYARIFIVTIVAYALSPIDLIPDSIPIIGYVDDLLLLPLGVWLAFRLVPATVIHDCRNKVSSLDRKPWSSRLVGALIVLLWVAAAVLVGRWLIGKIPAQRTDALLGY